MFTYPMWYIVLCMCYLPQLTNYMRMNCVLPFTVLYLQTLLVSNLCTWSMKGSREESTHIMKGGVKIYSVFFYYEIKLCEKLGKHGYWGSMRKSLMQMSTYFLKSTVAFQFKLGCNLLVTWFFPKLISFSNVLLSGPVTALWKALSSSFWGTSLGWSFSFCCSSLNLISLFLKKLRIIFTMVSLLNCLVLSEN